MHSYSQFTERQLGMNTLFMQEIIYIVMQTMEFAAQTQINTSGFKYHSGYEGDIFKCFGDQKEVNGRFSGVRNKETKRVKMWKWIWRRKG